MCGIFAYLGHSQKNAFINEQFQKAQRRGPEFSTLKEMSKMCIFGFHRLAINGLNETSNQPLTIGDVTLICNGEIYNYRELYEQMGRTHETDSDCEIIIHLYRKYGMKHTLSLLDGVFSFILLDNSNRPEKVKVYAARDPYGVRPLFISQSYTEIVFASELKQLCKFNGKTKQFAPGTYSELTLTNPNDPSKIWDITKENEIYTTFNFAKQEMHKSDYYIMIYNSLKSAVEKRVTTTERPIACLLSGGLDSSLITALVCEFINPTTLETYSIGFEGSEDIIYASQVAAYLGTKHTNVIVTEEDFFKAIPEVICAIESYDTTTVRASVGNYLIAKYISEHSEAKVIFNGDGSDELIGGYLYFNKAPDQIEFDRECKRLLNDIHYFDVLRSERCI
jgi:asparagine synthase (glutamine-hydrolysing)